MLLIVQPLHLSWGGVVIAIVAPSRKFNFAKSHQCQTLKWNWGYKRKYLLHVENKNLLGECFHIHSQQVYVVPISIALWANKINGTDNSPHFEIK